MKGIDETYFNKENLKVHHDKHVAKDELDYIENEHVANKKFPKLLESMSEEDFNNMFDRIYNKYQVAFERLA